jgi:hypothetical protein
MDNYANRLASSRLTSRRERVYRAVISSFTFFIGSNVGQRRQALSVHGNDNYRVYHDYAK